ncbi:MAG: MBL fold metallo-hydrolase [Lachnospiraceae bacterium]|nr:MBL fold metallo-hydrolase [Lachnospiraceae bacterium]
MEHIAERCRVTSGDDTWRIEDGGVRFFLFCGSEKALLIDTGMNAPDARQIAESLTDLPLLLINTHADPDHISGNGAFERFYMSSSEEDNYRAHGGKGELIPVREGDVIDLGGRSLQVIDIPGHTPGSIALLDAKNRILVSGDSVQDGNIFMFGSRRNMELYIESLRHLALYEGQFDEIYPMHGSFPVSPDLIGRLLDGAGQIRDGLVQGSPVSLHGNDICLYKFPYAGFLCDPAGNDPAASNGSASPDDPAGFNDPVHA